MTLREKDDPPSKLADMLVQSDRLTALAEFESRFPEHESRFYSLLEQAAGLFDAPIARINLVDNTRQFTRCSFGSATPDMPAENTFCAHAIAAATPALVVLDTVDDRFLSENPQVEIPTGTRFYIGCPIRFRGHSVGTLCVADIKPRTAINASQKRMLIELAWDAGRILDTQPD